MDIASPVSEHATIMGSSTAERVINCPGSVSLVAKSPKRPPGEAAILGTAQHALIEHILLHGGDPKDFVGAQVAGVEMTKALAANVEIARESAETLLANYTGVQLIEQRTVHHPVEVFGTGDIFALNDDGTKALIGDHKFGYVEVSPNSYQHKFLAAVAIADSTTMVDLGEDKVSLQELLRNVTTFEMAIIQPDFDPAHVSVTFSREEIVKFGLTISLALTTAKSPDAPVLIGKWCDWCPAKLACPAWSKRFDSLYDLKKHAPEFSGTNLARIIHVFKDAEKLYKDAVERAKDELSNGRKVEYMDGNERVGWRLIDGKIMQNWTDAPGVVKAQLRGLGFNDAEIDDVISPAKVRKLKNYKVLPAGALDDMITTRKSEGSLARDSDEGAPAIPAAALARAAETARGNLRKQGK